MNKKSAGKATVKAPRPSKTSRRAPAVAVFMGSDSDYEILAITVETLERFGVPVHVEVVSAHRTPEKLFSFGLTAESEGFKVIIAGAGGAAHLPGMMASLTVLPVIGVPIRSRNSYQGLDSILSILQMPAGIPVATVALDGAENAALLAVQILAIEDLSLREALHRFRDELEERVEVKNKALQKRIAQ